MRWRSSAPGSPAEARRRSRRAALGAVLALPWAMASRPARAGAQQYEPLADAVRSALAARIADSEPPQRKFDRIDDRVAFVDWLADMSQRLKKQLAEGDNIIRRLSRIAIAARPASAPEPAAPRVSSAQAVAAAAQAFSDRRRSDGLAA